MTKSSKLSHRRNAQAQYDAHHGPNMTPMVDVVMVILIFFMASTAFLGPEWFLRSALPVVGPGGGAQDDTRRVRIELAPGPDASTTQARVADAEPMTMDRLADYMDALVKVTPPAKVVALIAPDPRVAYDDVVRVHELCARLGIEKVGIVEPAAK